MKTSIYNIGKEKTEAEKKSFISKLQSWMDSVQGQTFMNYAYSIGAAVVILGTLFKLTHLPGSNFFLYLGMGTEVFVFLLSAFDRPFKIKNDGGEDNQERGVHFVDSEMMKKFHSENLGETFNAVRSAYYSQLNSIHKQADAAEKMTEQSAELTHKMEELNSLYSRMIKAAKGID